MTRAPARSPATSIGPLPAPSTPDDVRVAIERLVAARPPLLAVIDFDGTLAHATRDSAATVIDPVARRAIRALARLAHERPGRLVPVILTGRTVRDVAARVRVGGLTYLGDHGLQSGTLERGRPAEAITVIEAPGFAAETRAAAALADGVAEVLGHPRWLFVERKGPSVAFHVRQADDVPAARAAVLAAVARVETERDLGDHGLAHYRGRSVVDLRPVGASGKREAVARWIAATGPGAVVALGDELSDVEAFTAIRAAMAGDPRLVGVTIAVHGDGGKPPPAELSALADLHLDGARAVGRFLGRLAAAVADASGGGGSG